MKMKSMKLSAQNVFFLPLWAILVLLPVIAGVVPTTVSVFGGALLILRLIRGGFRKRSLWLLSGLAIIGVLIVRAEFSKFLSLEAGISLVLAMAAIKVNDILNDSDKKIIFLLTVILASLAPMVRVDILALALSLCSLMLMWMYLLPEDLSGRVRYLLRVVLYSLPVMLLLFFLFPRVVVPWGMSIGSGGRTGSVGFSDGMHLQEMQDLAAKDSVAFIAKFDGPPIPAKDLYWRGAVLSLQTEKSWVEFNPPKGPVNSSPSRINSSDRKVKPDEISYEVFLEQENSDRFFLLESPRSLSVNSQAISLGPLGTKKMVKDLAVRKYRATSAINQMTEDSPSPLDVKFTPLGPQLSKVVNDIKTRYIPLRDRLTALNQYFSNLDLEYTLKPGVFKTGSPEEILLEKKKGFCGHFSSAYAILARALGIPARVIVGFQGATYNPYGDFYIIQEKDAHAWVEVYLNSWIRIDPTEWVAPARLEIGAQAFFDLPEDLQKSRSRLNGELASKFKSEDLLPQLKFWMQDLEFRWSSFIMNYDLNAQNDLLKDILANSFRSYEGGLLLLVLILFLVIRRFDNSLPPTSLKEKIFLEISKEFGKRGVVRERSEPPLSYLQRCREFLQGSREDSQALREALQQISAAYEVETYSSAPTTHSWRSLRRGWRGQKRVLKRGAM